jgi:hypothetical protein
MTPSVELNSNQLAELNKEALIAIIQSLRDQLAKSSRNSRKP